MTTITDSQALLLQLLDPSNRANPYAASVHNTRLDTTAVHATMHELRNHVGKPALPNTYR